jgi:hypothetical protein
MNMFMVAWWSWPIVTGPIGDAMTRPAMRSKRKLS